MTPTTTRKRSRSKTEPDAVAAEAADLARAGLADIVGEQAIGAHEGVTREGDRLVVHSFEARHEGYVGWSWKVLVARASRARVATVCDSWLEPGEAAVLAPSWVPWADRLRPDDVSATDRLPYVADDERLMAGFEACGDEDADALAVYEMGLGRTRVLSPEGFSEAATRWHDGTFGPDARAAARADMPCTHCGFYLPLAGSLRPVFGVCANEWSEADGRVVSATYGCGAHSETDVKDASGTVSEPVLDESGYELVTE